MERKKNIIFITGKNSYQVQAETERIIEAFRIRQDGNSIDRYRLEEMNDWGQLRQNIQTMGLFVEKRLFVLTGSLMKTSAKKGNSDEDEEKTESNAIKILLEICENIDDETFLLFSGVQMSEKSSLFKWIQNHADIRKFDALWEKNIWSSRFPHIQDEILESILSSYKKNLSQQEEVSLDTSLQIGQSLEKIELLSISRPLTQVDIDASILFGSGGKLFDLADSVLSGDAKKSLQIFRCIGENMSIDAFIPSFTGLLRGSVYTRYLKSLGKTLDQITSILPAHPFVIKKAYQSLISHQKLIHFYEEILSVNILSRSGLGLKDPELGRIFQIELAIMRLKK